MNNMSSPNGQPYEENNGEEFDLKAETERAEELRQIEKEQAATDEFIENQAFEN